MSFPSFANTIAAVVVLSLVAYVGMSILGIGLGLSVVGQAWFGLYSFITLMSATKLYGRNVYRAVKSAATTSVTGGKTNES